MTKKSAGALLLSLSLNRSAGELIGVQLFGQLRTVILSGGLAAGSRLPASRILARDLGVARSTVAEAYDRLAAEGLVEARVGSGTYVAAIMRAAAQAASAAASARSGHGQRQPRLSRVVEHALPQLLERLPHRRRCFTTAMPDFDLFPIAAWSRIWSRAGSLRTTAQLGYADPCGIPELRRAIAAHLRANRGIDCEPGAVIVFSGAQQAIHFIGSSLLNPGDKVWFENPGAVGARNSLLVSGAKLVPVPVDRNGLIVEEGLRKAPDFRLAFVTPTHQQPLAALMSLERRLQLLAAADRAGAMIIEDDYDGEFYYGRHPIPALQSIDRNHRVLYVGSFSKTLYPSLRLGYVVVPQPLIDVFAKAVAAFLPGVPTQIQAAVAEFIESGQFAVHVRAMRRTYRARYEALLMAADRHLAGALRVEPTDAGLHTIGTLEATADENRISLEADAKGVTVAPFSMFCVQPLEQRGFVLGFSVANESEIQKAVRKLAQVIGAVPSPRPT